MKRRIGRPSLGERAFDAFNYTLLTVITICTVYPLVYVLFASLSDPTLYMQHSGILWRPLKFSFHAYQLVFENPMIIKGYVNTFIILAGGLVLNIILTAFGAYALSRKGLRYRKPLMLFIVFTMFFNGGLIPLYFTVKGLGLTNSLWSLMIPQAISAFNLIIMRTAFEAVPDSLEESAKIDGAHEFVILFRIMIPLCMPVMAVMLLYYGVSHWNSWFNAMIYLQDRSLYPLQLVLRELLLLNDASSMATGASGGEVAIIGETLKHATIIVATVPILLVYPFLQKYFVKGALIGAVKG
ncbi:carbohydrate ABC transporter permease [Paenibacillus sp. XY044]|uniref:carbohydrate ABC transporter permease n=1 Tax=Paenibacillus sp. XY044 TaxID=2026089 RepID=UPI000B98E892|nr:carbohydrate ABC transporter permease [Paenibacillus sp. XY044]OZB92273.1 sugar ABC transporter permease [Paenibacillus sp. XY044]